MTSNLTFEVENKSIFFVGGPIFMRDSVGVQLGSVHMRVIWEADESRHKIAFDREIMMSWTYYYPDPLRRD